MKRLLTLVLCLLLLVLPNLSMALTQDEIDWQVDDYFKKSRTTGGALVVVSAGEIVYEHYYGYQDKALEIPLTANTYFRIASVTKMISGIGLMQLYEQGLVELDVDISTYFGYEIANTYYPDTPITLRQLMSHTSTLSVNGGYGSGATIHDMLAKELKRRGNYTDNEPGSVYAYSNFGAGVVGAIMEAVTGVSVNEYMTENVFQPLGLDAAYDPGQLSDPSCIPNIYAADGSRYRSVAYMLNEGYEDFADPENHYRTTVGSLWIRADDLATLAIALCGNGSVNGVQLLTPESISLMRDDQATYGASVTGESPYGLFTQREETLLDENHTLYGHQGMFGGILCNVYFEPATQFCFIMLTNGCNNVLEDHVGVLARRQFAFAYETFVTDGNVDPFLVQ
ncbi:MAG TPA: serine hydrolase domain-containing protein [Candidatus Limiplasma sp.]|nr:serine hydrolase domain-containing protein [Candidatus Limiplasma sp.]